MGAVTLWAGGSRKGIGLNSDGRENRQDVGNFDKSPLNRVRRKGGDRTKLMGLVSGAIGKKTKRMQKGRHDSQRANSEAFG